MRLAPSGVKAKTLIVSPRNVTSALVTPFAEDTLLTGKLSRPGTEIPEIKSERVDAALLV